jgi:hypothetical protein
MLTVDQVWSTQRWLAGVNLVHTDPAGFITTNGCEHLDCFCSRLLYGDSGNTQLALGRGRRVQFAPDIIPYLCAMRYSCRACADEPLIPLTGPRAGARITLVLMQSTVQA